MKRFFKIFKKLKPSVKNVQNPALLDAIKRCSKLCLDIPADEEKARIQMKKGLTEINKIVNKLDTEHKMDEWYRVLLYWSCLSLCVFFTRELGKTEKLEEELDLRKAKGTFVALLGYQLTLEANIPEKIMDWFLKFCDAIELWSEGSMIYEIIRDILKAGISYDVITVTFLKNVTRLYVRQNEELMEDVTASMKILFSNLKCKRYTYETRQCLRILLNVYHSLYASRYKNRLDGILCEAVLKSLESFTSNIEDDRGLCHNVETTADFIFNKALTPIEVVELGRVVSIAAHKYQKIAFSISLTETVSTCILHMINSTDKNICLMGYEVLKHILDRHRNKFVFNIVRLYKRSLLYNRYDLNKQEDSKDAALVDGKIFHNLNHPIHKVFIESILRFKGNFEVLKRAYISICLMVFEVKSHLVAINAIHIAMTLQEAILREQGREEANLQECAIYHGYILAIISFVCYEHSDDCEALCTYVDTVIAARKRKALYLLPMASGKSEFKLEDMLIRDSEVFFELSEIYLAIDQSWSKYKAQREFIQTDQREPPLSLSMDEVLKRKDDGVTTFDTLIMDEFGRYLRTSALNFGTSSNSLRMTTQLEEPQFRPGHAYIMSTVYTISEYFDRFHFQMELRTPFPSQDLVLSDTEDTTT